MTGRPALNATRAELSRRRGAPARFLSRRFLGGRSRAPTATTFFPAAALFVDRLPGPLFRHAFRRTPAFVAFFDMFSLAFLFVCVFVFGSFRHGSMGQKTYPNEQDPSKSLMAAFFK